MQFAHDSASRQPSNRPDMGGGRHGPVEPCSSSSMSAGPPLGLESGRTEFCSDGDYGIVSPACGPPPPWAMVIHRHDACPSGSTPSVRRRPLPAQSSPPLDGITRQPRARSVKPAGRSRGGGEKKKLFLALGARSPRKLRPCCAHAAVPRRRPSASASASAGSSSSSGSSTGSSSGSSSGSGSGSG